MKDTKQVSLKGCLDVIPASTQETLGPERYTIILRVAEDLTEEQATRLYDRLQLQSA